MQEGAVGWTRTLPGSCSERTDVDRGARAVPAEPPGHLLPAGCFFLRLLFTRSCEPFDTGYSDMQFSSDQNQNEPLPLK